MPISKMRKFSLLKLQRGLPYARIVSLPDAALECARASNIAKKSRNFFILEFILKPVVPIR